MSNLSFFEVMRPFQAMTNFSLSEQFTRMSSDIKQNSEVSLNLKEDRALTLSQQKSKGLTFLCRTLKHLAYGPSTQNLISLALKYFNKTINQELLLQDLSLDSTNNSTLSVIKSSLLMMNLANQIQFIKNPTYLTGNQIQKSKFLQKIEELKNESILLVDESYIFLLQNWKQHSIIFNQDCLQTLKDKNCEIVVFHDWNRIFENQQIRSLWSNNIGLIEFIKQNQDQYIEQNFSLDNFSKYFENRQCIHQIICNIQKIKENLKRKILQQFPFCHIQKRSLLPFLKINFKSLELANKVYDRLLSKNIELLKNEIPTILDVEILNQNQFEIIVSCLEQIKKEIFKPSVPFRIDQNVIYGVLKINIEYFFEHEQYIKNKQIDLKKYLKEHQNAVLPSILVCAKSLVIIDGHHRLSIYKQNQIKQVPVLLLNYENENILTHPENNIPKQQIIARAFSKNLYTPKSTKHMIIDLNGQSRPLISISVAIDEKSKTHLSENFNEYIKRLQTSRSCQEMLQSTQNNNRNQQLLSSSAKQNIETNNKQQKIDKIEGYEQFQENKGDFQSQQTDQTDDEIFSPIKCEDENIKFFQTDG